MINQIGGAKQQNLWSFDYYKLPFQSQKTKTTKFERCPVAGLGFTDTFYQRDLEIQGAQTMINTY